MTDIFTSNQCLHAQLTLGKSGWHCAACLRIFHPSGETGAEQAAVRLRSALEMIRARAHTANTTTDEFDGEALMAIEEYAKGALSGDSSATETFGDPAKIKCSHPGCNKQMWTRHHYHAGPAPLIENCPKCGNRMVNWPGQMTKCTQCLHEWYMDSGQEKSIHKHPTPADGCSPVETPAGPSCGHPNPNEEGICPVCREWRESHAQNGKGDV